MHQTPLGRWCENPFSHPTRPDRAPQSFRQPPCAPVIPTTEGRRNLAASATHRRPRQDPSSPHASQFPPSPPPASARESRWCENPFSHQTRSKCAARPRKMLLQDSPKLRPRVLRPSLRPARPRTAGSKAGITTRSEHAVPGFRRQPASAGLFNLANRPQVGPASTKPPIPESPHDPEIGSCARDGYDALRPSKAGPSRQVRETVCTAPQVAPNQLDLSCSLVYDAPVARRGPWSTDGHMGKKTKNEQVRKYLHTGSGTMYLADS
jgi:hypothetical protein